MKLDATIGVLLLTLCASDLAAAEPVRSVTGADGRTVEIADSSRIVAVGGTITEVLYALGVEDRVVAVDLTSTFPWAARSKPQVGYMRALSAEGVLSLTPTLILSIEDAGPKETISVLQRASVPFILVAKAHDAKGVAETIRFIAEAVGEPEKGAALADAVSADLAAVRDMLSRLPAKRKAVFVLGLSGGAPLVAGNDTAAADIFALANVDNALAAMNGYRPANDEATISAAPDAVVLMADRSHHIGDAAILGAPAFAGTPAAANGRLIRMSGPYLLNFGPRTAHAARDLAAALYPEVKFPALPVRPWTRETSP